MSNSTVLPQNLEMEQAIIGSMMISPRGLSAAREAQLTPDDFLMESHAEIFRAITALDERGNVDEKLVCGELTNRGTLKKVGGSVKVLELTATVPATANSRAYAEEVKRQSRLRWLVRTGEQIAKLGYEPGGSDTENLINQANELVAGVSETAGVGEFVTADEVIRDLYDVWWERYETQIIRTGLATGFWNLDDKLGGFQPDSLNILAARPGMGKTSLATTILANTAFESGTHSAVFSLEMSAQDVVSRMTSGLARVPAKRLKTGRPEKSDFALLENVKRRIATEAPQRIHIDQSPSVTPFQVRDRCRRLNRKLARRKQKLGLVVVDYLQLADPGRQSQNRNVDVGVISRELKKLAMELGAPVLALSQLSRAVETRDDKRPVLSDLRDSGSIEQDADTVMFIYRPEAYGEVPPELVGIAEVIIAKNRHGEKGTALLNWLDRYTTFTAPPNPKERR